MKKISAFFTVFIILPALALVIGHSMPAAAQKTAQDEKSTGTVITLKPGVEPAATPADSQGPSPSADQPKASQKAAEASKNADYWFDRGALCATYGNDRAAVKYFQKAMALDPRKSGAYFSQGVSYGRLGQYTRAVKLISQALEMEPENGLYYYGRGWVYLLAGDRQKAMADFKKAASLDDEDAQAYLQRIAKTP